jgi:ADP-heptose:LPS heptosyltransferase
MENKAWIINRGPKDLDFIDMDLKKQIVLKVNYPYQVPVSCALRCVKKYTNVTTCNNPEKYLTDRKLNQLIIRDAGIGDLLLLEPVLRKLNAAGQRNIDILTRYPEVLRGNPYLRYNIKMNAKGDLNAVDRNMYDCVDDYRSYSETSPNRHRKHRTDIYNEIASVSLSDAEKEPRIYFEKGETSKLKKKKGYKYIGIQVDASHSYRKFDKGLELANYIVDQDEKNIVVLLGSSDFIDAPKHDRIMDLQCKTSIREAINIIKKLDYMIAVDSGLMHVALALHIPTVCIFSIISPEFRLKYYTGPHVVVRNEAMECLGCGDFHMVDCKHGSKKHDRSYLALCMLIEPKKIYDSMKNLKKDKVKKFETEKTESVNIIPVKNDKLLTMPIIVQNEEKNLPRFIELVVNNPYIGRVIAIDGGSNDKTVQLLEKAGCEVYVHPYIKSYHDQQAMQRNISCSYVKDGENIIIMDIDECFSNDLKAHLPVLCESNIDYGIISRRTYNYFADINDASKRIKDYPDYQPRFYKWNRKYKFVGGAHHITLNCPEPVRIDKDIIHFEKEGKDRVALENQWAGMMQGVKQYA